MTAHHDASDWHWGHRPKASREGTRGRCGSRCCRTHYGDFEGAIEDVGVDEVCDGPTVKPRSFRNEAPVAWELVPDADPSFAGLTRYGLG